MIETKNLTKRFGGLVAVNNVSLKVHENEILGLIGPNGAGKTTLLNAIAGQDPPTSGNISFLGKDTTGFPAEKMCHLGLSRTFQIPRPFPKLSVLDNVMMAAVFGNRRSNKPDPIRHSLEMLEFVEFDLDLNILSESLNTVQLKRVDLARALASQPRLLLLDELASGLTEAELSDLMRIIHKVRNQGVSIIIVEHIMEMIMNLCDNLVVIQFGNKIACGPTQEVANNPQVAAAYLGDEEE